MGTVVSIQVVGHGADHRRRRERQRAVERAIDWFRQVELSCSRFDPASEVRALAERVGEPVPASTMLLEAVRFALAVAEASDGAFDPTVGRRMERRGFNRNFRTGGEVRSADEGPVPPSWRDVEVDVVRGTITLRRPLVLDLGAVAKGLAIDMAARELRSLANFAIDAGGDLYLAGRNGDDQPWSVGIRHPREPGTVLETLRVSGVAVCTSGDYERPATGDGGHHIIDPRSGESADALASVTVVAPTAIVGDALATAAFVMGRTAGPALLERHGVDGLFVTPALERFSTPGMPRDAAMSDPHAGHAVRR